MLNLLTPALGDAEALSASPPSGRRTCRPRRARRLPCDRRRVLRGAGDAAADDWLRPAGFTRRAGGVDDRSRYGQLPEDRPRFYRRAAVGQSHPRPHRRQHQPVLADRHRGVGCALVLGRRTKMLAQQASLPGRSRSRPASRRSPGMLADPPQLGREGLPQRHLLQRGGQGRPLRRLGGTGAFLRRVARRLPPAALAGTREPGITCTTVPGRAHRPPRQRLDRTYLPIRASTSTPESEPRSTPDSALCT